MDNFLKWFQDSDYDRRLRRRGSQKQRLTDSHFLRPLKNDYLIILTNLIIKYDRLPAFSAQTFFQAGSKGKLNIKHRLIYRLINTIS